MEADLEALAQFMDPGLPGRGPPRLPVDQQGFLLLRPLSPPDACLLDAEAHRLMAAHSTDLETAGHPVDPAALREALTAALVPRLEAV